MPHFLLLLRHRCFKPSLIAHLPVPVQLLAASSRTKKALKLSDKTCEDFVYLNRGDTATSVIEGVPDAEAFVRTMEILALLGIENSAQLELLRILSGILHLGQIQFIGDSESSKVRPLSFHRLRPVPPGILTVPSSPLFKGRRLVRRRGRGVVRDAGPGARRVRGEAHVA